MCLLGISDTQWERERDEYGGLSHRNAFFFQIINSILDHNSFWQIATQGIRIVWLCLTLPHTPGLITSHLQAPVGYLMKRYGRWRCGPFAEILKAITQTLKGCARAADVSSDCQSEGSRRKRDVRVLELLERRNTQLVSCQTGFSSRLEHASIKNVTVRLWVSLSKHITLLLWYLAQAELMETV